MKKITLAIALLLASAATMFAQEGFKMGLRFSPVFASARVTDSAGNVVDSGLKSRVGISYGLLVNYGFSDNLGLYTGLHIVDRGYTGTNILSQKVNQKVQYVELPLALKMRSNQIGGVEGLHIRGLFGVSGDVKVAATSKVNDIKTNNSSSFQPVNASFIFGAGVDWTLDGIGTFDLGATYHRGLLNTLKNSSTTGKMNLNYLSIDLGYMF